MYLRVCTHISVPSLCNAHARPTANDHGMRHHETPPPRPTPHAVAARTRTTRRQTASILNAGGTFSYPLFSLFLCKNKTQHRRRGKTPSSHTHDHAHTRFSKNKSALCTYTFLDLTSSSPTESQSITTVFTLPDMHGTVAGTQSCVLHKGFIAERVPYVDFFFVFAGAPPDTETCELACIYFSTGVSFFFLLLTERRGGEGGVAIPIPASIHRTKTDSTPSAARMTLSARSCAHSRLNVVGLLFQ